MILFMAKHITSLSALAKKNWFKEVLDSLIKQGYNKTKIAVALGITPQRLTNISNGTFAISDKMMDKITATFNLGIISISTNAFPDSDNQASTSEVKKSEKNGNAIPIVEKKGPLERILQLFEEEGVSLEEFARSVNSSATLFNNAVKWPNDSRDLILGNDKAIRGWINAFCDVFPKYSKFWILTGKTSKYNYPYPKMDDTGGH